MKSGDKILILILGGLGLFFGGTWLFSHLFLPARLSPEHPEAFVELEGRLIRSFDLTSVKDPFTFRVETSEGHYNLLLLEPGRIRFIESDCPHGICIASGWLSRPCEMALCLPHKVLVYIEGNPTEEASVDAVAH